MGRSSEKERYFETVMKKTENAKGRERLRRTGSDLCLIRREERIRKLG